MAKNSGITKGKSHKEGGMPMTVKSTGQKIEVEGGEGIINKYVMSSDDKFEFEGKEKTSCEIISELNQKKGDGVSFDCNTVENKKYKFDKGGSLNFDSAKTFYEAMESVIESGNEFIDKHEYKGDRYGKSKLAVNIKLQNVNYGIDEALDSYQTRRGNFDLDKEEYVKKDLRIDEEWAYEMYNSFLDDQVYFLTEDLLETYGGTLDKNQLYQVGRMGGWLVFSDDGELNTNVDELETILNANFSAEGDLVGDDRWGYDMEPVTFTEFKEDGDYEDAVYYAKRINLLLDIYKEVAQDIKKAKDGVADSWKAHLDEKVDEHISQKKKRFKLFKEDDPDFSKGGELDEYYSKMVDKLGKDGAFIRVLKDSQFSRNTNMGENEYIYFRNGKDIRATVSNEKVNLYGMVSETFTSPKELAEYLDENEIYAKGGFTTESQEAWSKMTTAQRIEKTKDERRVFPKGSAPYQRLSNMISVLEEKDYAKGGSVPNKEETRKIANEIIAEYKKLSKLSPSKRIQKEKWELNEESLEAGSFEIDLNGEMGDGGSYYIKGDEVILASMTPQKAVYNWKKKYSQGGEMTVYAEGGEIGGGKLTDKIKVRYIEEDEIHTWTIEEAIDRINEDSYASEDNDLAYDTSDWLEGWDDSIEGEFYSLNDKNGKPLNKKFKLPTYAEGGMIEYIVSTEIEDEEGNIIDLGLNVFASSEEEAMNKAQDNIREKNPQYEDSSIDIISVNKRGSTYAEGGEAEGYFEYVNWEDVRGDMKYPESDNNKGLIYGINLIDEESEEIMDVEWYKTSEEREASIKKYNLKEYEYAKGGWIDFKSKRAINKIKKELEKKGDTYSIQFDSDGSRFGLKGGGRYRITSGEHLSTTYAKGGELQDLVWNIKDTSKVYIPTTFTEEEIKKEIQYFNDYYRSNDKNNEWVIGEDFEKTDDGKNWTLYAYNPEESYAKGGSLEFDKEDVMTVAKSLKLNPNKVQVQYVLDNMESQADADPTGNWTTHVEDLLYEQDVKGGDIIEDKDKYGTDGYKVFAVVDNFDYENQDYDQLYYKTDDEEEIKKTIYNNFEEYKKIGEYVEGMEVIEVMSDGRMIKYRTYEDYSDQVGKFAKGGKIEERVYAIDMRANMYQDEGFFTYNQFKRYADDLSDDEFMDEAETQGLVWSSMDGYIMSNEYNEQGAVDNLVERKISVKMMVADEYVNPKLLAKGGRFDGVKPEYKALFKKYLKQEDGNQHTENALMIVKEFGTEKENERMVEIKNIHKKEGHLPYELYTERYEISQPHYSKMFYAKGGSIETYYVFDYQGNAVWQSPDYNKAKKLAIKIGGKVGKGKYAKGGKLQVKGLEEKALRYWQQAQPKDINGDVISFDDFKEDLKKMSPDRIYAKGGKFYDDGSPIENLKFYFDGEPIPKNVAFSLPKKNYNVDLNILADKSATTKEIIDKAKVEVEIYMKNGYYDTINYSELNDITNGGAEEYDWGFYVYPETEEQLMDVLKSLNVSVSKERLADIIDMKKDVKFEKGGIIPEVNLSKITELVSGICSDLKI